MIYLIIDFYYVNVSESFYFNITQMNLSAIGYNSAEIIVSTVVACLSLFRHDNANAFKTERDINLTEIRREELRERRQSAIDSAFSGTLLYNVIQNAGSPVMTEYAGDTSE